MGEGRGAASRVRVSPELVEAHPGQAERTRWGQQFDASLTNVFEVQADIATKVADALGVALADSVRAGLEARPTTNLEAYDAFLKGEAASGSMTQRPGEHHPGAAVLPSAPWRSTQLSSRPGRGFPRLYATLYANL